ncbi:PREDICTED: LOW QUALITY PROTEIN: polyadenylate-binding protein 1-like [Camelina sativa]|uniref:LOW QUALITY PROTEIN: polyadenylate-binding protein 1-like n=1 Tax=Camelina sativa TaxID=90675 RepID=A0ABM0X0I2_CAMSA|nr:PREDICTED: LOW QUALITY PROTEIN: polyadenylate-binding protein 1-like [Camelina sativa]
MDVLNFHKLKGKPMRIMFSERDPSKRRSGRGNVFVKNLHESVDSKQLCDMFSTFGKVLSSKVVCDASGVSKGYGFVQFYSELSVHIACNVSNRKLVRNQHIYVCPFVSRRQWDESPVFTNVYVKNLAETATDADLKMLFGEFGEITSAVVMKDGEGRSRRFGFVNFDNAEDAVSAIEKMNGTIVDEKTLYVGRAQRKNNRVEDLKAKFKVEKTERDVRTSRGLNLYVKNLEDSVDNKKLQELFSEFGTITSCKVMVHSNRMSKGVGFVEFSTTEEASEAMLKMDGKMVGNQPIYVSLAQCKEERRFHDLQTRFNNLPQNVVSSSTTTSSPHQHPFFSQAAAPATMLFPQPPGRGYNNFQPYFMCGSRLPNSCPPIPIPNFMVPQLFRPTLYPCPPVSFHPSLPQPLLQPKLLNPPCNNLVADGN